MRKQILFVLWFYLPVAHPHADTCFVRITIDTVTQDSFIIHWAHHDTSFARDTITKSKFIVDLFNRFDSATIAFIGKVDTIRRINFQEDTVWKFKDHIKVKIDTVLKGTLPGYFWFTEVDPRYFCDSAGTPTANNCEFEPNESYRGYGLIQGRTFIAFGEDIASLRNTSVSPSNCQDDYGNYIVNDTIYSDYFASCPKVKVSLHEFYRLLENRPLAVRNRTFEPSYSAIYAGNNGKLVLFDILGRKHLLQFRKEMQKNLPPGLYFFFNAKGQKLSKKAEIGLNTFR